jgi:hypothetical protein
LSLRSRVKSQLEQHPVVGVRVGDALRRAGGARLARRVFAAADIVTVQAAGQGAHPFAMARVKGSDQIAAAANTSGTGRSNPSHPSAAIAAVDPSVEVHAFEPYPPVLEVLHANVRINVRGSRVRVFAEVVGGARDDALLHIPNPSHGLVETSASLNPAFRVEHDRTSVAVTVTTCCRRATSRPSRPSERRVTMSTCVFVHTRPS